MPPKSNPPFSRKLRAERHRRYYDQRRLLEELEMRLRHAVYALVWEAVGAKHSPVPDWVFKNASLGSTVEQKSVEVWIGKIILYRKFVLEPGYYRERNEDGSRTIVHLDPDTGQKWVLILDGDFEEVPVTFFEVEVNLATRQAIFLQETGLTNLNPDDFELFYE